MILEFHLKVESLENFGLMKPMLINFLKMKLVGVVLSEHYFYIQKSFKSETKTKPGLIPPFYVDMPKPRRNYDIRN